MTKAAKQHTITGETEPASTKKRTILPIAESIKRNEEMIAARKARARAKLVERAKERVLEITTIGMEAEALGHDDINKWAMSVAGLQVPPEVRVNPDL